MTESVMTETMVAPLFIFGVFFIAMTIGLGVTVLYIVAFWKICSKAGLPGALSLLMLIPVGNFILPLYLAFAKWPALPSEKQT